MEACALELPMPRPVEGVLRFLAFQLMSSKIAIKQKAMPTFRRKRWLAKAAASAGVRDGLATGIGGLRRATRA